MNEIKVLEGRGGKATLCSYLVAEERAVCCMVTASRRNKRQTRLHSELSPVFRASSGGVIIPSRTAESLSLRLGPANRQAGAGLGWAL
jgi:hypothetical protein